MAKQPEVIPTLDDSGTRRTIEPVKPGDVYRFACDVDTRAGHVHPKGSLLTVVDVSTAAPWGEISESGRNWICRTDFGESSWSTLEQCIARGLLVRVNPSEDIAAEVQRIPGR